MKIITWNVNGIRACIKKGLVEFMKKENADIYCFQEVKSQEIPSIEGYSAHGSFAEKRGYSGVVIYSKKEPLSIIKGISDKEFDSEGRVIVLEFKEFFLVNAYVPHPRRELERLDFKLRFSKKLEQFCNKLASKKQVILAADLNVAHTEDDLANPKQNKKNGMFTPEEREWIGSFLKKGYTDAFREFTSGNGHYTWWPYRNNLRKRNVGWRIDYFLTNNKNNIKNCEILSTVTGSDHCPVRLELK